LRLFGHNISGFPRAILTFAAVILGGTAICGIDQVIAVHRGWSLLAQWPNTLLAHLLGLLNLISLIAVVLSALGLATSVVTWPVVALFRRILNPHEVRETTSPDLDEIVASEDR
jgi:hypothetical protein